MSQTMNAAQVREMFLAVARKIIDSEDALTEIDLRIGDGDHGTGMATGFRQVLDVLPQQPVQGVEEVFLAVGNTLLDTMGGASGVLFGTMFISGIVRRQVSPTIDIRGMAEIFRLALDAIKGRGGARLGDKTMVDALEPAVSGLEQSAERRMNLVQGLALAAARARDGMERSRHCRARFGRAKAYGQAAIGCQDPGATSVWLIFQAMSDWVAANLAHSFIVSTLTLNPCIDRTIEIDRFCYGGSNPVLTTRGDVSGKGINVSIVLRRFGRRTACLGFNYTETHELTGFLQREEIPFDLVDVPGRLRLNTKIFDRSTSVMSEFNEMGAPVSPDRVDALRATVSRHLEHSDILVVNGSVPPGVPADVYAELIRQANALGKITILDAYGELLRQGTRARPFLVKPNVAELAGTYSRPVDSREDIISAARMLIAEGATYVCVSMGNQGAMLVSRERVCFAANADIEIRGVQGAGDSMVAGICMALEDGVEFPEILRYGAAAAHGSLIHEGTQLCGPDDFSAMIKRIEVQELEFLSAEVYEEPQKG